MIHRILRHPAHPYTVKLLQSIPSRSQRQHALQTIEGRVPAADKYPPGCRFAARCPITDARCQERAPVVEAAGEGRTVRCFKAGQG